MSFVLSRAWDKEKNSESPWGIEPQTFGDSTVSDFYYEVHMTRVLHTAGISNVDSVMIVNRMREMICFELGKEMYEGLTFETAAFKLFTVADLRHQLS